MSDDLYADEWQPIESAPRDGIVVHLKSEDGDDIGYFDMGGQARVAGR